MIPSVIQHADGLSACPRQHRLLATLMYDAITTLVKSLKSKHRPCGGGDAGAVGGGVRMRTGRGQCINPPAALTPLSPPNQRLENRTTGTSSGFTLWRREKTLCLHVRGAQRLRRLIHYGSSPRNNLRGPRGKVAGG